MICDIYAAFGAAVSAVGVFALAAAAILAILSYPGYYTWALLERQSPAPPHLHPALYGAILLRLGLTSAPRKGSLICPLPAATRRREGGPVRAPGSRRCAAAGPQWPPSRGWAQTTPGRPAGSNPPAPTPGDRAAVIRDLCCDVM